MADSIQRNLKGINQTFKEREVQKTAEERGIPYVNLIGAPLNPDFVVILSEPEARASRAGVFMKSGKKLKLAVSDPDFAATQTLIQSLQTRGFEVVLHLCSAESLEALYAAYARVSKGRPDEVGPLPTQELGSFVQEIETLEGLKAKIENASSEIALNAIVAGAYRTRSSDIHFQPEKEEVLVRFRIDGVLQHVFNLSKKTYQGVLTQVKYMARMKANIVDTPQDGQYSFLIQAHPMNVRTSTLPTQYGEACVLRLLDPSKTFSDFKELGYHGQDLSEMEQAVSLSHGMILITGPTGSGKTTTMYSMLKKIDVGVKKVITLEDPIEYHLPGISQSQVDPAKGFDFSDGLRAILRQDPDIIMIGEIRDLPTAETAAQASLTGHLVISTLHTNSAIEAIPRLVNMGVRSFILAPALKLIVAQRLVRKVCACATQTPPTEAEAAFFNGHPPAALKRVQGCPKCSKTGYLGQTALAEVLRFDDRLRDMILENRTMPEIYRYVHEEMKMPTLREDGLSKVAEGVTTLEEVMRVTA